jgi:hypothetical protein
LEPAPPSSAINPNITNLWIALKNIRKEYKNEEKWLALNMFGLWIEIARLKLWVENNIGPRAIDVNDTLAVPFTLDMAIPYSHVTTVWRQLQGAVAIDVAGQITWLDGEAWMGPWVNGNTATDWLNGANVIVDDLLSHGHGFNVNKTGLPTPGTPTAAIYGTTLEMYNTNGSPPWYIPPEAANPVIWENGINLTEHDTYMLPSYWNTTLAFAQDAAPSPYNSATAVDVSTVTGRSLIETFEYPVNPAATGYNVKIVTQANNPLQMLLDAVTSVTKAVSEDKDELEKSQLSEAVGEIIDMEWVDDAKGVVDAITSNPIVGWLSSLWESTLPGITVTSAQPFTPVFTTNSEGALINTMTISYPSTEAATVRGAGAYTLATTDPVLVPNKLNFKLGNTGSVTTEAYLTLCMGFHYVTGGVTTADYTGANLTAESLINAPIGEAELAGANIILVGSDKTGRPLAGKDAVSGVWQPYTWNGANWVL